MGQLVENIFGEEKMSKRIRVKDKVVVNKDIIRYEEQYETDIRLKGEKPPKPSTLEEYHVIDWAKFRRQRKLYATEGEEGVVIDTFHDCNGGYPSRVRHFAKVKIGDKIKTFRTTSLEKK